MPNPRQSYDIVFLKAPPTSAFVFLVNTHSQSSSRDGMPAAMLNARVVLHKVFVFTPFLHLRSFSHLQRHAFLRGRNRQRYDLIALPDL